MSVLIFGVARLIPGDPVRIALGPMASQVQVEAMRERLHLNDPIWSQYIEFVKGLVHGDLGVSLYTKRPVIDDLLHSLPATLELVAVAALIMTAVGLPLGILAARYQGASIDRAANLFALLCVAAPSFVWAIFLMLGLAYWLDVFPIAGRLAEGTLVPPTVTGFLLVDSILAGEYATFRDALWHLVLPATALSLGGLGTAARLTRANLIEAYGSQYVQLARAFAYKETEIAVKYALRPALIPTLTILGLDFALMLGNAFLVEMVFAWPGMAKYGVEVILRKDLNGIVGVVIVISAFFLIMNVIVDLMVAFLNPRIRLAEAR